MLVNGTGQSFQRKLHLQPFIMFIMMWFVALSFSFNQQDRKTDPDPNPVALGFQTPEHSLFPTEPPRGAGPQNEYVSAINFLFFAKIQRNLRKLDT